MHNDNIDPDDGGRKPDPLAWTTIAPGVIRHTTIPAVWAAGARVSVYRNGRWVHADVPSRNLSEATAAAFALLHGTRRDPLPQPTLPVRPSPLKARPLDLDEVSRLTLHVAHATGDRRRVLAQEALCRLHAFEGDDVEHMRAELVRIAGTT